MKITRTIQKTREQIKLWKKDGYSIGFVPTMGYLHEGHQSLMKKSILENDKTVVSIFINPMQFDVADDLKNYPISPLEDMELCDESGVDLIFNPSADEVYHKDFFTYVDMHNITKELCGKNRPNHFRGVCTVVNKLFNIITPDCAYFGEKDAQQLAVIKKMVKDLNMDLEIVGCPTVRESDGLAKSSRNAHLNPEERKAATILSKAIFEGRNLVESGERDVTKIVSAMKSIIDTEPLATIDHIEIVDGESIQKIETIQGSVLGQGAIFIGKVRLIDNFMHTID